MNVSIQAISWVIENPAITDRTEWAVLIALANRTSPEGWCWPSHDRIARESRSSRRTVQRVLAELVDRDVIQIEGRKGRVNRYFLPLHNLRHGDAPVPDEQRHYGARRAPSGGAAVAPSCGARIVKNRQEPSARVEPVDNFNPLRPSDLVLSEEQRQYGRERLAEIRQELRARHG